MSDGPSPTARERLRSHLQAAQQAADDPVIERELQAALEAWRELPPTPLRECPVCGQVGLPDRIAAHRCQTGQPPDH